MDAQIWYRSGVESAARRDFEGASTALRYAARLAPTDPMVHFELGNVLSQMGRHEEAATCFGVAIRRAPRFAPAHQNLGNALRALDRRRDAARAYRRALEVDPSLLGAYAGLAALALASDDPRTAEELCRKALRLAPNHPGLLTNLGSALRAKGDLAGAIVAFERALTRAPDVPLLHYNLGNALRRVGELDRARTHLERAVAVDGDSADARRAFADLLRDEGRLDESLVHYTRALEIRPGFPGARFGAALSLLGAGRYADAWPGYEARFEIEEAVPIAAPVGLPRLAGAIDDGMELLLVAEQGFGDVIQFARFAAPLAQRGVRPHLHCDARLVELMRTTRLFASVHPYGTPVSPTIRAWLPLLSVPSLLGLDAVALAGAAYLCPDPARVAAWHARLPADERLKVGIGWRGSAASEQLALRGRSIPLAEFAPLAALANVLLVSLQKGPGVEERGQVPFGERILDPGPDFDEGPDAFLDTAALAASLDAVVTSDTALAHVAAALGRPTLVLLHATPAWHWQLKRSDSPWYPTVSLYRQAVAGQWGPVFDRLSADLSAFRS